VAASSGLFTEMSFKRGNFGEAADVPLGAGKAGAEICAHKFYGELGTDDTSSEAEYIDIVVCDALTRGEGIVAGGGTDSAEFVGRYTRARSAAADQDRAFGRAGKDRLRNRLGEIRVIHRIGGIGAEIDEFVTFAPELFNHPQFEHKTGMVARHGYFHYSPSIAQDLRYNHSGVYAGCKVSSTSFSRSAEIGFER
jgi:hypothetical protein